MGQAKAKTAYDQQLAQARYEAAQQAAMANYTRQNQVSDTNVGATNDWRGSALQQLMALITARNPGVNLPTMGLT
jgi:hypothetical protein